MCYFEMLHCKNVLFSEIDSEVSFIFSLPELCGVFIDLHMFRFGFILKHMVFWKSNWPTYSLSDSYIIHTDLFFFFQIPNFCISVIVLDLQTGLRIQLLNHFTCWDLPPKTSLTSRPYIGVHMYFEAENKGEHLKKRKAQIFKCH